MTRSWPALRIAKGQRPMTPGISCRVKSPPPPFTWRPYGEDAPPRGGRLLLRLHEAEGSKRQL